MKFSKLILVCSLFASSSLYADVRLRPLGTYSSGIFAEGGAEIAAFDSKSKTVFVVNGAAGTVDVLDISDPTNPRLHKTIDATEQGDSANSVDIHNGLVAVAIQNVNKVKPGVVALYNNAAKFIKSVRVGALPDMLVFTPDGKKLIVANEGEPNDEYTKDPEGSVSIIDLSAGI